MGSQIQPERLTHTPVYKRFSTILDKGLRKNIRKKEEVEKSENKLNEIGALNMRQKKWNKLK